MEQGPNPLPEPTQLPIAPVVVRDAALSELQQVATTVRELTPDLWKRDSAAEGWSIGDVVAHLNVTLALYGRILDAIRSGLGAGKAGKALGRLSKTVADLGSPALNAVNTAIPRIMDRALAPEVVQGQLAAGVRTMSERLHGLESEDYSRPVYYMDRQWPLSFFLSSLVNELAMHAWDIESRLRPDAHLSESAGSVLPWFYWSGTPFMFRSEQFSGTIQILLTDPALELWWSKLPASGEETEHGTGQAPTRANATVSGQAGTFVLTLGGRIPGTEALRSTSLTVEGDQKTAETFLSGWKIL